MIKKLLLFISLFYYTYAESWTEKINKHTTAINQHTLITKDPAKGLILDHLGIDAMIAAWGFKNWHWGTESFHFRTEDWFEYNSDTGGSDKTGHFYMTYLLSRVLSSRMEERGWDSQKATLAGSLSALLTMTLLEVGDGTSTYGFSKEDLLADSLGALSAYFIRSNPQVDDFIDIRLEYMPSSGYLKNRDTATDYSGMKHLIAFQFSGFEKINSTPLHYVEIQLGYYTRGYRSYDRGIAKSQQVYIGIGINLHQFANKSGINVLKNIFEFYQPGGTYLEGKLWKR